MCEWFLFCNSNWKYVEKKIDSVHYEFHINPNVIDETQTFDSQDFSLPNDFFFLISTPLTIGAYAIHIVYSLTHLRCALVVALYTERCPFADWAAQQQQKWHRIDDWTIYKKSSNADSD